MEPFLIILLTVFLVAAFGFIIILLTKNKPEIPSVLTDSLKDIGAFKSQLDTLVTNQATFQQAILKLESGMKGVETKIVEQSSNVKEAVTKDLNEARRVLDGIKTEYDARKRTDEEMQGATRRIEAVLVGSRSRGESGENILSEAFKQFPAGMIDYNFKVKGKPVEYALILSNQKRLPIDSKWPAEDLLKKLAQETDLAKKLEIEAEIEKLILKKVKEVTQYIDPVSTTPQAIAAVPDAVFSACKKAHIEAYKDRVLLMPYSMTIPYILALYNLYLQYSRSIEIENLEGYLSLIDKHVSEIDKTLENSISRGATMISNAYQDCKKSIGEIRGAIAYLKAVPAGQEKPALIELSGEK